MPTLVTGASGFLGGRLAQLLAVQGEEIVVLARKTSHLTHLHGMPIRIAHGDLGDCDSLREAVHGVTRIIHCAACSTDWAPWSAYYTANVAGAQNLLDVALRVSNLERFVHISTTDVYGYPDVPCDESHPSQDAGLPYNQSKRLGELAVWKAHRDHGLPVTILRPATIYGPRGKDFTLEVAMLLRQRLMATINHGRAPGGFAYVDNVANAIMNATTHPAAVGEAFNLSDGTNATWKDYLTLFSKALGMQPPWIDLSFAAAMSVARFLEVPHRLFKLPGRPLLTRHALLLLARNQEFPTIKARETFGFSPEVSLEEGIARSAGWFRDRKS